MGVLGNILNEITDIRKIDGFTPSNLDSNQSGIKDVIVCIDAGVRHQSEDLRKLQSKDPDSIECACIEMSVTGETDDEINVFSPDSVFLIDFDPNKFTSKIVIDIKTDDSVMYYHQFKDDATPDEIWSYERKAYWVISDDVHPSRENYIAYFEPVREGNILYSNLGRKIIRSGIQIDDNGHIEDSVLHSASIVPCTKNTDYQIIAKTFIPIFLMLGLPAWGNMEYYQLEEQYGNTDRVKPITIKNDTLYTADDQPISVQIDHTSGAHTYENYVEQLAITTGPQNAAAASRFAIIKYNIAEVYNIPKDYYSTLEAKLIYDNGKTKPIVTAYFEDGSSQELDDINYSTQTIFSNDETLGGDIAGLLVDSNKGIAFNDTQHPLCTLYSLPLILEYKDSKNPEQKVFLQSLQEAMYRLSFDGGNYDIEQLLVFINRQSTIMTDAGNAYLKRWTNQLAMKYQSLQESTTLNERDNAYDRIDWMYKRKFGRDNGSKVMGVNYTQTQLVDIFKGILQQHNQAYFKVTSIGGGYQMYVDVYYNGDKYRKYANSPMPNEHFIQAYYIDEKTASIDVQPQSPTPVPGLYCSNMGRALAYDSQKKKMAIKNTSYLIGYQQVTLNKRTYQVHRAVASTWKQENLMNVWDQYYKIYKKLKQDSYFFKNNDENRHLVVHHIDSDTSHSHPNNLEWVTGYENTIYDRGQNGIGVFKIEGGKEKCVLALPYRTLQKLPYSSENDLTQGEGLDIRSKNIVRGSGTKIIVQYDGYEHIYASYTEFVNASKQMDYFLAGDVSSNISVGAQYVLRRVLFADNRFILGRYDTGNAKSYAEQMAQYVVAYCHTAPVFSIVDQSGTNVIEEYKYDSELKNCQSIQTAMERFTELSAETKGYRLRVSETGDNHPLFYFINPGSERFITDNYEAILNTYQAGRSKYTHMRHSAIDDEKSKKKTPIYGALNEIDRSIDLMNKIK